MPPIYEQPGLLFVWATLLPLASFVILLCWGGLRWGLRPYAERSAGARAAFEALGGAVPGRGPAYVALAAIALACVCSVTGFTIFLIEHHQLEEELQPLRKKAKSVMAPPDVPPGGGGIVPKLVKAPEKNAASEKRVRETIIAIEDHEKKFEERWAARVAWLRVWPRTAADRGDTTTFDPGNGTMLQVGYRIDMLAAVMFAMVTFVATLIHLFSMGYMADELNPKVEDHEVHTEFGHYHRRGRFGRFFMFLSLFCFSMLNLLLADNLMQVFVSWELVGVCSFLLIGFYYERHSASTAANKAFITNRVGDAGFIIGLLILFTHVGTFNIQELSQRLRAPEVDKTSVIDYYPNRLLTADRGEPLENGAGYEMKITPGIPHGSDVLILPREELAKFETKVNAYNSPRANQFGYMPYWMLVVAGLGIFLGCVGKSAQFPLQVWLPDAMEGPTPVSALIHAATMVAAGVYLVGRVYPLFTPEALLVIAYTGAITLFVAATIAVVMTDIKKVLAYSTVSQLGFMILALGVGGWAAGLFHLVTHAFFKALLFLGSGSVIYGCHHQQDMLKMGGLHRKMKTTSITMLVGVLAISGVPLFAGWYSKDAVISAALDFVHPTADRWQHPLLLILPLVTAGITTFYMFRMWFLTFTGKPRDHHVYEHAHESPWTLTVPLVLLAVFSVIAGWGLNPINPHGSWLEENLHHAQPAAVPITVPPPESHVAHDNHETAGNLALLMVLLGLAFAGTLYYSRLLDPADAKEQFPGVHRFLTHKWYFDEFYSAAIVRPGLVIAGWARAFDAAVIDGLVNGVGRWSVGVSRFSGKVDRNVVDGLVNVFADTWYAIGTWLRSWQTGYIRTYILFLGLAAVAIFALLAALFGVVTGAP